MLGTNPSCILKIMNIHTVLKKFLHSNRVLARKIRAIYLFGSRARGDHRANSDYDLLLVVRKNFTHRDKDKLYETVMDVLLETGNLLSLKIFDDAQYKDLLRQDTPFIQNVKKERVLVG